MQPTNTLLSEKKIDIEKVCDALAVEKLYAFGSVVGANFSTTSDIDLLVKFKHDNYGESYFALLKSLKEILNKEVDLVTFEQVSNPFFIAELNRTKVQIYGN